MSYRSELGISYDDSAEGGERPFPSLSYFARHALADLCEPGEDWVLVVDLARESSHAYVELCLQGEVMGLGVRPMETEVEFRREVVDALQDIVIDMTFSTRPECLVTEHHHPAEPVVSGIQVRWQCPTSPTSWNCGMGEYHSS